MVQKSTKEFKDNIQAYLSDIKPELCKNVMNNTAKDNYFQKNQSRY